MTGADPLDMARGRGVRAKQLLEDEMFTEGLAHVREAIVKAWKLSPIRDVAGQEKLRLMWEMAEKFEAFFLAVVDEGKVAEATLQAILREREAEAARERNIRNLYGVLA